ncbi:hypothetical protein ACJMK2_040622, partial [Sinanodonta woodiana]
LSLGREISIGGSFSPLTTWLLKKRLLSHARRPCFLGMRQNQKFLLVSTYKFGMQTTSQLMTFSVR